MEMAGGRPGERWFATADHDLAQGPSVGTRCTRSGLGTSSSSLSSELCDASLSGPPLWSCSPSNCSDSYSPDWKLPCDNSTLSPTSGPACTCALPAARPTLVPSEQHNNAKLKRAYRRRRRRGKASATASRGQQNARCVQPPASVLCAGSGDPGVRGLARMAASSACGTHGWRGSGRGQARARERGRLITSGRERGRKRGRGGAGERVCVREGRVCMEEVVEGGKGEFTAQRSTRNQWMQLWSAAILTLNSTRDTPGPCRRDRWRSSRPRGRRRCEACPRAPARRARDPGACPWTAAVRCQRHAPAVGWFTCCVRHRERMDRSTAGLRPGCRVRLSPRAARPAPARCA